MENIENELTAYKVQALSRTVSDAEAQDAIEVAVHEHRRSLEALYTQVSLEKDEANTRVEVAREAVWEAIKASPIIDQLVDAEVAATASRTASLNCIIPGLIPPTVQPSADVLANLRTGMINTVGCAVTWYMGRSERYSRYSTDSFLYEALPGVRIHTDAARYSAREVLEVSPELAAEFKLVEYLAARADYAAIVGRHQAIKHELDGLERSTQDFRISLVKSRLVKKSDTADILRKISDQLDARRATL